MTSLGQAFRLQKCIDDLSRQFLTAKMKFHTSQKLKKQDQNHIRSMTAREDHKTTVRPQQDHYKTTAKLQSQTRTKSQARPQISVSYPGNIDTRYPGNIAIFNYSIPG